MIQNIFEKLIKHSFLQKKHKLRLQNAFRR